MRLRYVSVFLLAVVICLLSSAAALGSASLPGPTLTATGETLSWTTVPGTTEYKVHFNDLTDGVQGAYLTSSTSSTPAARSGDEVRYWVKAELPEVSRHSNIVKLSYGAAEEKETEAEREAKEKAEKEAEERAEREAKEKAEQEAREKAEREAKEKAEKEAVASVNAAPTGPSGSWKAVYADAFGKPLSEDTTGWVKANRNSGCCGNSDEIGVEREEQITVDAEGLKETCTYVAGTVPGSNGSFYNCAGMSNHKIGFELGRGATFAVELYARLPYSTGEMDPGWWSTSNIRYPPEIDWFEEWAYGSCYNPAALTNVEANKTCIAGFPVDKTNGLGSAESYAGFYAKTPPGDPSTGLHRYTIEISGSASKAKFDGFIDGVKYTSFEHAVNTDPMGLILTNAMRTPHCYEGTKPNVKSCYFKSGTRVFTIRSAAIYEDAAHAGQFVTNGAIAPGTKIG